MPAAAKRAIAYRPVSGEAPCKDCPFRRRSLPGWLGHATPQSFIIEISYEHPLPCHPTIDYGDPEWLDKWTDQKIGRICAGSLVMAANMCKRPRDPAFPRLPSDRETVFASPAEFIAHHEGAAVLSWEMDGVSREVRDPSPLRRTQEHVLRKATSMPKPKKKTTTPKPAKERVQSARDLYVEEIRDALETSSDAMPRADYIDALEEIADEIASMLEAARIEQKNEDEP